jgi:pimeloyl-ACP methyl ester carboxylesterase
MTWILLRGLGREARHWGDFTGKLAAHTGQQVIPLDLPGNGEYFLKPSPASVCAMLESARQQLHERHVQAPFNLLGMSLGGMVAASWAQEYPDEVGRLVLVNTSMRPFSLLSERLRPGNWPQLAGLTARWHDPGHAENIERLIHQLTCNRTTDREADIAAWTDIRRSAPVSSSSAARQLWAAARFSCAPAKPACPVLVLSSNADHLVHPLCSSRLAIAWQASHHQHPWAGHDLAHDDGEWVCTRISAWITES